jgi:general secretion pathway protein A
MIQYRLKQSSAVNKKIALFTYPALWVIYHATQGYPRKIVNLCHRSILAMIIQNKSKANFFLVQSCIRRAFDSKKKRSWQYALIVLLVLIGATIYLPRWLPQQKKMPVASETVSQKIPAVVVKDTMPDTPAEKDVRPTDVVAQAPSSTAAPKDSSQSIAAASIELRKHTPTPEETHTTQTVSIASKSTPAEVSANDHNPPGVLGHLRVKRRETLGGLIQQIYGVFSSAYLQSVMRVNPHISDPDTIAVGEIILFPAIPSHVEQQPLKHWWVEIANHDDIEDVFRLLRKYPLESPSARLIPYWNRSTGLHFSILLTQYFYDEASAQNKMKSLSSRIASNGRIVSEWDKHTVFYANPYQKHNK